MIQLGNKIYCKQLVLDNALSLSRGSTQLVRRLLSGVLKLEAIRECTLTGREFKLGSKKQEGEDGTKPKPLHRIGGETIVGEYKVSNM